MLSLNWHATLFDRYGSLNISDCKLSSLYVIIQNCVDSYLSFKLNFPACNVILSFSIAGIIHISASSDKIKIHANAKYVAIHKKLATKNLTH